LNTADEDTLTSYFFIRSMADSSCRVMGQSVITRTVRRACRRMAQRTWCERCKSGES
jgi:hypothetical protein